MSTARKLGEHIGERITAVRERKILTQKELAAELGIPARSLQDYESGRAIPRQARLRQILAWLDEHEASAAA